MNPMIGGDVFINKTYKAIRFRILAANATTRNHLENNFAGVAERFT
jgi:hypothetical protein